MSEPKKERRISKLWIIAGILFAILLINQIPIGYYYSQPGDATGLQDIISVEDGSEYEEGEFYLTTILQSRANPFLFVWSYFSPYRVLTPEEMIMSEDETDEEYHHRQVESMRQSQDSAKIAAYRAAGATVHIEENGVFVTQFVDDMGAAKKLDPGDVITAVDGERIRNFTELNQSLAEKEEGDMALITVEREGEIIDIEVEMMTFPESEEGEPTTNTEGNNVGIGIIFPVNDRDVTFEPEVAIEAGSIGGPSAGLMFSLEIYNQLQDEDVTRGLNIAGTGSIDEEGNVGRIGGISQKVVAADNAGIDVFFTPNDEEYEEISNYFVARETAEDINTDMSIVPVDTLQDAIDYLREEI